MYTEKAMSMSVIPKTKVKCPIAMEWSISEQWLKEMVEASVVGSLKSRTFDVPTIPGVQYCLRFFPYKQGNGEGRYSCIYFSLISSGYNKIEADLKFTVESANYAKHKKAFFLLAGVIGLQCCTPTELFERESRFIVDGKLTITMEGTLMVEKEVPLDSPLMFNYSDSLCLGLWCQEETKDFKIVAGGKEIHAHKCILATRSPVFARMFQSGMKEAQEGKVEIKDFSFVVVEAAIKLLYHRNLVSGISTEDKMMLLQFFDKYYIQLLKDDLEVYLVTVIDETNVCRLTNTALLSNARRLEDACAEFLRECLDKKNPISDFDLLDKDFAINLLKKAFYPISE